MRALQPRHGRLTMTDPWPLPWLKGHRTRCTACDGEGIRRGLANGATCKHCRGRGFVSKPPAQIVAEMINEARAAEQKEPTHG